MASTLANAVHVPLYVTTATGSLDERLPLAVGANVPLCTAIGAQLSARRPSRAPTARGTTAPPSATIHPPRRAVATDEVAAGCPKLDADVDVGC
jgi:hypothetical protein